MVSNIYLTLHSLCTIVLLIRWHINVHYMEARKANEKIKHGANCFDDNISSERSSCVNSNKSS